MDYMRQALSLAELALGQVSPNPAVGAVVVKDGEIAGRGYTQPPGYEHAEIMALKQAGEKSRGSVMYVTLEPCCHHGRTPPCTRSIIDAGVSEVHIAMLDVNPQVLGSGLCEMEESGINVSVGECEEAARDINEAYIKFITTGMPFITAKFAVSLDGKIATRSGESRWITGETARRHVHKLRYINDAVMTGVNTVIADDPKLTVRCCGKGGTTKHQPLRVIVDGKGRIPLTAQVFREPGRTVVVLNRVASMEEKSSFTRVGAELIELPSEKEYVELHRLLKTLGEREITSVLVEGGSFLLGSLFDEKLVDKVIAFIAPVIIGGEQARTAVGGGGIDKITDALRLKRVKVEQFGEDVMVSGYIEE